MTTIGGALPPHFLRVQIKRKLVPGTVIKLNALMDDGKEKEKRYVILSASPNAICCVINSEMNAFVKTRPAVARHHVPMNASSHEFMDHDSFVDCTQTKVFPLEQVVSALMERTDWILGNITLELRDDIILSLKTSSTIPPNLSKPLCEALASIA